MSLLKGNSSDSNILNDLYKNPTKLSIPKGELVDLSHGTLKYRESGKGRPILFLHGLNGSSRSWIFQLNGLSKNFRVISWDAPGFGGSDPCAPNVDAFAIAAMELLQTLEALPAVVVGHSMGGVVATRMAAFKQSPVNKLILSCTHWGYGMPKGQKLMKRYAQRLDELTELSHIEYGRVRASKMLPETVSPVVFNFVSEISRKGRIEGLENAGRMMQETDNRQILTNISAPIMIISAEKDPIVSKDQTAQLLKTVPSAKSIELRGVGHVPYIEDPKGYNRVVEKFVWD